MRIFRALSFVLLAALVLPGCATALRGSTEVLVIQSDPLGANVKLSSGHSCVTPCAIELKRKSTYLLKFTKEGYQPIDFQVVSVKGGGGAVAGNIILGGLIGWAVDSNTGANKDLKPNPVAVKLVAVGAVEEFVATEVLDANKENEPADPDEAEITEHESEDNNDPPPP